MLFIGITPSLEAESPNPKIPTCFTGIPDLLGVLEHFKLALDVSFFVRDENFLHSKLANWGGFR
jgi:hypothetical protein